MGASLDPRHNQPGGLGPPGALPVNLFFERFFRRSALCILSLTAAAKILSATGHAHVLELPDPLLGMPTREVLFLVALLEIAVALVALSRLSAKIVYLAIGWLSLNFLLYRLSLAVLRPGKLCPCLGTVTERLNLSPTAASYLLLGIALYLFLGSCICYVRQCSLSFKEAISGLPAHGPAKI